MLITTLTKRMAEDLTEYLDEHGVRVRYLHSDIETVERVEIIRDLRLGKFDVLVGINLLREGLDMPEVSLVAILDADKEGFLRSEGSLIQTIGRAARNVNGRAILYADRITGSIERATGRDAAPARQAARVQRACTASRRAASARRWPTSWKARAPSGGDGGGRIERGAEERRAARTRAGDEEDQEARGGDVQVTRATSSSRRRRASATKSSGCGRCRSARPASWRGRGHSPFPCDGKGECPRFRLFASSLASSCILRGSFEGA